jgi:hypothetical protein
MTTKPDITQRVEITGPTLTPQRAAALRLIMDTGTIDGEPATAAGWARRIKQRTHQVTAALGTLTEGARPHALHYVLLRLAAAAVRCSEQLNLHAEPEPRLETLPTATEEAPPAT